MQTPAQVRELLLDYKLNRLSPAARKSMDERMFREAEFSAQLEEAEYDLLSDYRDARLSPEDRARVEEAFPAGERARVLLLQAPAPVEKARAGRVRLFSMSMLALSFCVLLAVVVLGLWRHGRSRRPARLVATNAPPQPGAGPSPRRSVTLLLTPEVTRDASALRLVLVPQANGVRVQWVLPAETHNGKFELTVATLSGAPVVRAGGEVSVVAGRRLVQFSLPTAELHPGASYQFTVSDSHQTAVREYRVTVARR